MIKHYVTFLSPGTFVAEQTTKEIPSWDIETAVKMARKITERYNAVPYGFYFSTRVREEDDFDSKRTEKSKMYFLGGKVETLTQVKNRATDKDRVLIANMEYNHHKKIITNDNSWRWTQPFEDGDAVLDIRFGPYGRGLTK